LRYTDTLTPAAAILVGVGLVVFWFHLNGYMVFGVDEATLRSALHHALGARGLSHEDRPGIIHVPSEQVKLELQHNPWGGTAAVKASTGRGRPLLRELSKDMKRFLASHPVVLRKNVFVYTWVGALLVGLPMMYLAMRAAG
jgi:hypothetical protein